MRKAIVISSGHGKKVRGASCAEDWGLDEVDEARRVVPEIARHLRAWGIEIKEFHDDTSTSQSQNLETIVDYHNSQVRDLDVSIHFNAYMVYDEDAKPNGMGCEVLYISQKDLAVRVVNAIVKASGLVNRHEKYRDDLYFLNETEEPAILVEVCFVDSQVDCELYGDEFDDICKAIARALK